MTTSQINASTTTWTVVEIWDTEVPDEILEALHAEQELTDPNTVKRENGSVYSLMWGDCLVYHGEDGWCLNDETLDIVEPWLEEMRESLQIWQGKAFWFRVKTS